MRKTNYISLLISLSLVSIMTFPLNAQVSIPMGSPSEIRRFENSKTYIVKENIMISDYNLAIEKLAEEHWYLTNTKTISFTEFRKKRKNPNASFIYMNPVYFEDDKTQTAYEYMFLSLGDSSGEPEQMTDLCAVPLAVKNAEQEDYVYKIGLVLQFMQNHVITAKQNNSLDEKSIVDYYTSQPYRIENKELWLIKSEIETSLRQKSGMKSVYPYPFRYVEKEDVTNAIAENRDDVIILHLIPAGKNDFCFKLFLNAGNAELYYYDHHKINNRKPSFLLGKDLKKFAK